MSEMANHNFGRQIFEQFARIGAALGNANRLQLLELLAQGERNVETLSQIAGLSLANTSQHLRNLRQAGLVTNRKSGLKVFYRISNDDVVRLISALRRVAECQSAEVETLINKYLTVKDDLEPVRRLDLLSRARDGLVTVLDVRPPEEFAAGHIPGAINIPLIDLERRLKDLTEDEEIVAYCRGPHCVLAFDAIEKLRQYGFKAQRLEDGYPEWRASGLPIEQENHV
jgi:rhodanese-related sulfurtransferase/DNA-binding transcriptional ArsR family regulator